MMTYLPLPYEAALLGGLVRRGLTSGTVFTKGQRFSANKTFLYSHSFLWV